MSEEPSFSSSIGIYIGFCVAMYFIVAILHGIYRSAMLGSGDASVDVDFAMINAVIPLIIASPIGVPILHFGRYLAWEYKRDAENTKAELANLVKATNAKLGELQEEIQILSEQLQISFPVDSFAKHSKEIQSLVDIYGIKLLKDATPLNNLVAQLTQKAKEDRKQLKKAKRLYQSALSIFADTSRHVNKVGSIPLIKELEQHEVLLNHKDIKYLLLQGRWDEYHSALNVIIADLQRLKDLAVKYELYEEGYEKREAAVGEETKEQKAYRILGIPPTATSEQIRRVCLNLRKAYHPDQVREEDREFFDNKLKDINWAFDILKAARKMS